MHRKAREGLVHVKGLKILKHFKVNERDHEMFRGIVRADISTIRVPAGDVTVVFTHRYLRMNLEMIRQWGPGKFYLPMFPTLMQMAANIFELGGKREPKVSGCFVTP